MVNLSNLGGLGLGIGNGLSSLTIGLLVVIILVTIWKLIWYGMAVYKTIERKQITWFTVLFVATFLLGDLGILAIIYLLIYRKPSARPRRRKR